MDGDCGERKKTQPWPLKSHGGDGTGDGSSMAGMEGVTGLAWCC